ncbi:hypothetical protein ACT17_06045 [Mycolicibacterium conceptionense]|uniref:Uncharacterized protein n=1 Tax=Mycolicibacterium conceptionense TaxID=451644 RepID=A0A0J8UGT7_9MYCO|nr:hypothetical protein [Mycolicibacterium conceptionense]KMV19605.1 hypothetical protein ACT17_06045 [Mycolicibacterium conceptionense]
MSTEYASLVDRITTEIPEVVQVGANRFERGIFAVEIEDCGTHEGWHEYEVARFMRDRDGAWERKPGSLYDNAHGTFNTVDEWLT